MDEQLLAVAREAQQRIDDTMARMAPTEIEGSGFDQAGIRYGSRIVEEYLRAGESGLAVEHVIYMAIETGISLTASSVHVLERVTAALGLPVPTISVQR